MYSLNILKCYDCGNYGYGCTCEKRHPKDIKKTVDLATTLFTQDIKQRFPRETSCVPDKKNSQDIVNNVKNPIDNSKNFNKNK